ncbi:hypothetical protein RQN30_01010 [Arcanobacterium hippocoleae]
MRKYFAKHAFSAATFGDLLDALTAASGKDVRAWSKLWFETAGVSLVSVERNASGVVLRQISSADTSVQEVIRPHLLKLSAWNIGADGVLERAASVDVELLDELRIPWSDLGVLNGKQPDAILPNDGALSYLKIGFDNASRHAFWRMMLMIRFLVR